MDIQQCKPINSHIQIPRFILKQFVDPAYGKVHFFDLKNGFIARQSARRLGVSKGYYSEEVEGYLNLNYEQPLSIIICSLYPLINNETDVITVYSSNDLESIVKQYVSVLMVRSNLALQSFYENSKTAMLFDEQTNHDSLVIFGTNTGGSGVASVLKDTSLQLIINDSNRKFVIPRNGYYEVTSNGFPCIFVPFHPQAAFVLRPTGQKETHKQSQCEAVISINEDDVYEANLRALRYENIFNEHFVAGIRTEELEELKQIWESRKEFFEQERMKFRDDFIFSKRKELKD